MMNKQNGNFQLGLQTLSLIVGFMVWSIISPIMPFISKDVAITGSQLSIVIAIPVILGSILRVPFGYLTNKVGAKWIFFISFIILLFPIFFLSQAQSVGMLMTSGFFLGIAGATFSVGVTSIPKYFPKERVGLANGIYGMGNIGTAISSFLAPPIAGVIGWQSTVRLYLILLALFAILMFFFGDSQERKVHVPLMEQTLKIILFKFLVFYYFRIIRCIWCLPSELSRITFPYRKCGCRDSLRYLYRSSYITPSVRWNSRR